MITKVRKHLRIKDKGNIWYFILGLLFSVMMIVSCHIFYEPNGNSTVDTTYVTDFHILDLAGIVFLVPIVFFLVKAAVFMLKAVAEVFQGKDRKKNIGIFLCFSAVIFIAWLPYLFSYWPGGIYSDTVDSINMALGKAELDSHNPVLYTMIWRFIFWITGVVKGESIYDGLNLFTVLQTLLLALVLAGFLYYCYKKGIHKAFICVGLLLFMTFPLYPFYGISMWKDSLFSMVLFVFCIYLYHLFAEHPEDISIRQLVWYGVLSAFVIFLRNNGIYIAAFYSVLIILMNLKRCKRIALKIGVISFVVIMTSWIIQGPVFDRCGYNIDRAVESFGVPIQQTAYILATDGNVTSDDLEVLNEILPLEKWNELYNPVVADYIKFDPDFNRVYFEENTAEFFKTYIGLVMRNPVKAVKAYMLETMGFWNVFENSPIAYISNVHFGNVEYFQSDYFEYLFGISFRNMVEPKAYISAAIFIWFMFLTVSICLARRYYIGIIPILPTIGLWLSIMVATPVAFSFRYVYSVFLCAPLYLLICMRAANYVPQASESSVLVDNVGI